MKKILYLGTDPSRFQPPWEDSQMIHAPLIDIEKRPANLADYAHLRDTSHILFTSKYGVLTFLDHLEQLGLSLPQDKQWIAVGKVTATYLESHGITPLIAKEETQEGVIALLQTLSVQKLFIPKSSRSRKDLFDFLDQSEIPYHAFNAYDTKLRPFPQEIDWQQMDLIVFTSPSTVEAFVKSVGVLPPLERCHAIGPITQRAWERELEKTGRKAF